jgi:hypothetical protein
MKYIQTREAYLKSLNEAFENDITWGGSLLGRLINSIIRKAKIGINYARIGSIANAIEDELNELLKNSMPQEDIDKVNGFAIKFLLGEIYDVVIDTKMTDVQKIEALLSKGEEKHLIDTTIEHIEKLKEGLELKGGAKDELVAKLNKFKEELGKIKTDDYVEPEAKDDEDGEEDYDKDVNDGEDAEDSEAESDEEGYVEPEKKENDNEVETTNAVKDKYDKLAGISKAKLLKLQNELAALNKEKNPIDKAANIIKKKEIQANIDKLNKTIGHLNLSKLLTYSQFMNMRLYESETQTDTQTETQNEINLDPPDDNTELETTDKNEIKKTNNNVSTTYDKYSDKNLVKEAWYADGCFKEGEEKEWVVNEDTKNRTSKELEKAKVKIDVDKSKDRIIRIANLFGKAYRLYVTKLIPSRRPGGVVSDKTYSEYTYLGKGNPPDNHTERGPGPGPWANTLVFNKFRDKILKLVEDKKYRVIFNTCVLKSTNGTPMGGDVLLDFITDMVDENEIRSFDEQRSKLIKKYFGLTYKDKKDKNNDDNESVDDEPSDETTYVGWDQIKGLADDKNTKEGNFIAIHGVTGGGRKTDIIGHILKIKNGYMLIKYQEKCEEVPMYYSEKQISYKHRWYPKAEKKVVCFGLIKLPIQITKSFSMYVIQYDLLKDGSYKLHDFGTEIPTCEKIIFKPVLETPKQGGVVRSHQPNGVALLSYFKEGIPSVLESKSFIKAPNEKKISKDVPINAKEVGGNSTVDGVYDTIIGLISTNKKTT